MTTNPVNLALSCATACATKQADDWTLSDLYRAWRAADRRVEAAASLAAWREWYTIRTRISAEIDRRVY